MHELYGTLVDRWYVTVLGLTFLWRAVAHMGWRKTVLYAVLAVGVGALFENGSVHLGLPYTGYTFNSALRGKEIFIGDVPLMVPLSYAFMGYFAFTSGRILASGPWQTRGRRPWHEYLLGVVLAVWALWIFDPVARLGNHWFLGTVFHYRGPGFWFGLPLGSQAGFLLTAVVLLGILSWLCRADEARPVPSWAAHPHLISLVTYQAQIAWLAVVALVIGGQVPDEIGGSALLMWVPVATMTAVTWSNLRPRTVSGASGTPEARGAVAPPVAGPDAPAGRVDVLA
jgi:putative membrane protein